jgi:hypothetical protein
VRDLKAEVTCSDPSAETLRKRQKHLHSSRNRAEHTGRVAHGKIRAMNLAECIEKNFDQMVWQPCGDGKRNKLME